MSDKERKCSNCGEYSPSVIKRGEYYNELLCTVCYDTKVAIDRLELERGY